MRDNTVVQIQLIHIPECPNTELAAERVTAALQVLDLPDAALSQVLVSNSEEAGAVAFAGSPTILLDGADLFPSDGRTTELACRVYLTEQGLAGAPSTDQIVSAIRARRS